MPRQVRLVQRAAARQRPDREASRSWCPRSTDRQHPVRRRISLRRRHFFSAWYRRRRFAGPARRWRDGSGLPVVRSHTDCRFAWIRDADSRDAPRTDSGHVDGFHGGRKVSRQMSSASCSTSRQRGSAAELAPCNRYDQTPIARTTMLASRSYPDRWRECVADGSRRIQRSIDTRVRNRGELPEAAHSGNIRWSWRNILQHRAHTLGLVALLAVALLITTSIGQLAVAAPAARKGN